MLELNEKGRSIINDRLRRFNRKQFSADGLTRAAVALIITDYRSDGNLSGLLPAGDGEAALVLTRRSSRLKNHRGQWALPGGKIETGETATEAALREAREEINLSFSSSSVLGLLDDYITRSGYHITPVVVWGGIVEQIEHNRAEVDSVHRISFIELMRKDSPQLSPGVVADRPVLFMPVGNTCIASPTAAILYQFREVIINQNTARVSHYDQPGFAWS